MNDHTKTGSVLISALIKAGESLGLNKTNTLHVVGVDPEDNSIDQGSRAGEKAALLIRIYIDLDSLMGGNQKDMRIWFHTANKGTSGIPAQLVQTDSGFHQVVSYLDGIRNHLIAIGSEQ